MESATWCSTPSADSAAARLRPAVSKNASTALSSKDGELARSTTTSAPARALFRPSPVMVLTPPLGDAARTSWPAWRRMATTFEPIRPVPPMTTIFMVHPPLVDANEDSATPRLGRSTGGRKGSLGYKNACQTTHFLPKRSLGRCRRHTPTEGSWAPLLRLMTPSSPYDGDTSPRGAWGGT